MREFLKDLFTLRTVWIDKGQGRWAVKKRLHPLIRLVLSMLVLAAGGIVYMKSGTLTSHNAEAITKSETVTAKLPEPEKVLAPVKPEAKDNTIIIPLNNTAKKPEKKQEIIWPSEADPDTDRIITKKAEKPAAPVKKAETPKLKTDGKYRVLINKSKYTLSLFKGDSLVKEYPVAVGRNKGDKQRVGDNRTPVGDFKIVSIENASSWTHDFHDGKGKISGAYGPWFLRLDAKGWKGIGIHGTHDPDSRGTNATEGCIRLSNEDIAELRKFAYKNMPVSIREN